MSFPIRLGEDSTAGKKRRRRKRDVPVKRVQGIQMFDDDDIAVPPAVDPKELGIVVKERPPSFAPSPPRKQAASSDDDASPPRRRGRSLSLSPRRRSPAQDEDLTPPRASHDSDSDVSPPRRRMDSDEEDQSPIRQPRMDSDDEDGDQSPPRASEGAEDDAGPQIETSMLLQRREGTVEKKERQKPPPDPEKERKESERWGKGSVQMQRELEMRMKYLEEIDKPFSRTQDDVDRENDLAGQDRFGDPMANYIKSRRKAKTGSLEPEKPRYKGPPPPPNRFNIPPGFRWDGVDRSSGFEKFWFQTQAARKVAKDTAYKWSTEDM